MENYCTFPNSIKIILQVIQTSITVDRVEPNFCFFPFMKYERTMVPDTLTKNSSVILNRGEPRSDATTADDFGTFSMRAKMKINNV